LTLSKWIRNAHRWISVAFTITVLANFTARIFGEPAAWLTYSPLAPLFLLLLSGMYMFILPYVAERGCRSGANQQPSP
jgi:hypothetical protein